MSTNFSLACPETKIRVWIGQGWGQCDALYSGEEVTMTMLRHFLNDHAGKPLLFINEHADDYHEYVEYGE